MRVAGFLCRSCRGSARATSSASFPWSGGVPGFEIDDGPGHPGGVSLLAVVTDDVGQLFFVHALQEVGRRFPLRRIHSHVERPVVAEGESAFGSVELRRGDAEVDQETVHGNHPQPFQNLFGLREPGVHQRDPVAERLQRGAGGRQSIRVAIDANQSSVRGGAFQNRARVTSQPDGRIAVASAGTGVQPGQDLVQKDGQVAERAVTRVAVSVCGRRQHERIILSGCAGLSSFGAPGFTVISNR